MSFSPAAAARFRLGDPAFIVGLQDLIACLPSHLVMAEVGVYAGASTNIFLDSGKVSRLYAVDQWRDYEQDGEPFSNPYSWSDVRDTFLFGPGAWPEVRVLELPSAQAAEKVSDGELDFVYLDACHDYTAVKADIAAWLPKIAAGGWLGGHDYALEFPGVVLAVVEAGLGKPSLFADTSWLLAVSG
jgi:hypothetical protein